MWIYFEVEIIGFDVSLCMDYKRKSGVRDKFMDFGLKK